MKSSASLLEEVLAIFRQTFVSLFVDAKARRFAIYGAIGCLCGALFGELLMWGASRPREPAPQDICLLVDCSASMQGQNHVEVQKAAIAFVKRQNIERDRIALVTFGRDARIEVPLTHDRNILEKALESLELRGNTAMDLGLIKARETLPGTNTSAEKSQTTSSILLFTDGKPNQAGPTIVASQACRDAGFRLIAIATGDADASLLKVLTGDPNQVFSVQSGDFERGFREAEKIIQRASLVQSGAGLGPIGAIILIAAWTSLISAGAALALIVGQNLYLHRAPIDMSAGLLGGIGGLMAGACAGATGQMLFSLMAGSGAPEVAGPVMWIQASIARLLGWLILGGLVGRGMAIFVPNLEDKRAMLGGVLGGGVAALAFILISLAGDVPGRLAGAALLGAFLGLMIAIIESLARQFFVEVCYGGNERVLVNLGETPVRVGGDGRQCAIFARGARPVALQFVLEDSSVFCTDYATETKSSMTPGDQRTVGNVTIVLRSQTSGALGSDSATVASTPTSSAKAKIVPPPPSLKTPPVVAPASTQPSLKTETTSTRSPLPPPKLPPPPTKNKQ